MKCPAGKVSWIKRKCDQFFSRHIKGSFESFLKNNKLFGMVNLVLIIILFYYSNSRACFTPFPWKKEKKLFFPKLLRNFEDRVNVLFVHLMWLHFNALMNTGGRLLCHLFSVEKPIPPFSFTPFTRAQFFHKPQNNFTPIFYHFWAIQTKQSLEKKVEKSREKKKSMDADGSLFFGYF